MQKQILQVEGMSCQGCVKSIEKALKQRDGVKNVGIDLSTDTVELDFDENRVSLEELKARIKEAGYDV